MSAPYVPCWFYFGCNPKTTPAPAHFLSSGMSSVEDDFVGYLSKFSKHYTTKSEFNQRLSIFSANKAKITEHNNRNDATYRLGINKFTDFTEEEYQRLLGYMGQKTPNAAHVKILSPSAN